jgi:3-phenylpropionate/trans-cinnamate dioxygenase ferredoxin subunit
VAKHRVARVDELKPGELRRCGAGGIALCLARTKDGKIHAIGDACTHEGASLSEGTILDNAVECADHGSLFDLDTGAVLSLPAQIPARTYPVTIEDGFVIVTL